MFGLSKFANKNKIETEGRNTQNICECKCRRNLHSAYVCYNSLFPIGKSTQEWTIEVIVVNWETKCTMWLVAPVSMIQESDLKLAYQWL